MLTLLKSMERTDVTVHGFRSTFRHWIAEKTKYPNEVAKMALGRRPIYGSGGDSPGQRPSCVLG